MKLDIRMTKATMKILDCLISSAGTLGMSGAELSRKTGLMSGTIYPILHRLECGGWLESYQEKGDPKILQRPRRRFYYLNSEARTFAIQKLCTKKYVGRSTKAVGGFNESPA